MRVLDAGAAVVDNACAIGRSERVFTEAAWCVRASAGEFDAVFPSRCWQRARCLRESFLSSRLRSSLQRAKPIQRQLNETNDLPCAISTHRAAKSKAAPKVCRPFAGPAEAARFARWHQSNAGRTAPAVLTFSAALRTNLRNESTLFGTAGSHLRSLSVRRALCAPDLKTARPYAPGAPIDFG